MIYELRENSSDELSPRGRSKRLQNAQTQLTAYIKRHRYFPDGSHIDGTFLTNEQAADVHLIKFTALYEKEPAQFYQVYYGPYQDDIKGFEQHIRNRARYLGHQAIERRKKLTAELKSRYFGSSPKAKVYDSLAFAAAYMVVMRSFLPMPIIKGLGTTMTHLMKIDASRAAQLPYFLPRLSASQVNDAGYIAKERKMLKAMGNWGAYGTNTIPLPMCYRYGINKWTNWGAPIPHNAKVGSAYSSYVVSAIAPPASGQSQAEAQHEFRRRLILSHPVLAVLHLVIKPHELSIILRDGNIKRRNKALQQLVKKAYKHYIYPAAKRFTTDIEQLTTKRARWGTYQPLLMAAAQPYLKKGHILSNYASNYLRKAKNPPNEGDKYSTLANIAALAAVISIPISGPAAAIVGLTASAAGIASAMTEIRLANAENKSRAMLNAFDEFDALIDAAAKAQNTATANLGLVIEILFAMPELKALRLFNKLGNYATNTPLSAKAGLKNTAKAIAIEPNLSSVAKSPLDADLAVKTAPLADTAPTLPEPLPLNTAKPLATPETVELAQVISLAAYKQKKQNKHKPSSPKTLAPGAIAVGAGQLNYDIGKNSGRQLTLIKGGKNIPKSPAVGQFSRGIERRGTEMASANNSSVTATQVNGVTPVPSGQPSSPSRSVPTPATRTVQHAIRKSRAPIQVSEQKAANNPRANSGPSRSPLDEWLNPKVLRYQGEQERILEITDYRVTQRRAQSNKRQYVHQSIIYGPLPDWELQSTGLGLIHHLRKHDYDESARLSFSDEYLGVKSQIEIFSRVNYRTKIKRLNYQTPGKQEGRVSWLEEIFPKDSYVAGKVLTERKIFYNNDNAQWIGDWQAAHALGLITGQESAAGIAWAPARLNQTFQAVGIEKILQKLSIDSQKDVPKYSYSYIDQFVEVRFWDTKELKKLDPDHEQFKADITGARLMHSVRYTYFMRKVDGSFADAFEFELFCPRPPQVFPIRYRYSALEDGQFDRSVMITETESEAMKAIVAGKSDKKDVPDPMKAHIGSIKEHHYESLFK